MMGWFVHMEPHGLMRKPLPMTVLRPFKKRRISLRDCSLLVSSMVWVRRTELSASTAKHCCVVRVRDDRIWLFSFLSWFTCAVRSSKCFCLRILDRLADSRFDIIRFRFFWSIITTCKSSSEPEVGSRLDPEEVPLGEAMEAFFGTRQDLGWRYAERSTLAKEDCTYMRDWTTQALGSQNKLGEDVEPVEKDHGEGLNKMGSVSNGGVYHTPREKDLT
ncbi:hypothetical protein GW17_00019514 [Ensete ventricosum]|nr:hypothetical protein GW17_00019514 [Ensete ventricosum]